MTNIFKLQQNRYFYIFTQGYLSEAQRCTFRFGSECKGYLCNWQAAGPNYRRELLRHMYFSLLKFQGN